MREIKLRKYAQLCTLRFKMLHETRTQRCCESNGPNTILKVDFEIHFDFPLFLRNSKITIIDRARANESLVVPFIRATFCFHARACLYCMHINKVKIGSPCVASHVKRVLSQLEGIKNGSHYFIVEIRFWDINRNLSFRMTC